MRLLILAAFLFTSGQSFGYAIARPQFEKAVKLSYHDSIKVKRIRMRLLAPTSFSRLFKGLPVESPKLLAKH